MIEKTSNNRSITLDLLLSTLKKFVDSLHEQNEIWLRKREWALKQKEDLRHLKRWDIQTRAEWDNWSQRITWNDARWAAEGLIQRLILVLESNPFPGERKKVVESAVDLFPDVALCLEPKVKTKGLKVWEWLLLDLMGWESNEWIWFPRKAEKVDIEEMERELRELAGERQELPLQEVVDRLKWNPNSKTYRAVKKALEERGWVWASRRINGVKVKVVRLPEVEPRFAQNRVVFER